jgi:putative (di)nucleoside polyphosphate hydrolase
MTPEHIATLPYRENVGIMLVNQAGEIWVGQRLDRGSYQNAWQMPQGGIDKGEDPRTAALRELEEETGVPADMVEIVAEMDDWLTYELPRDLIAKLWKGKYRGQSQKWFLMRYAGSDNVINIATKHPEFSDWKWISSKELVPNIVPFKREVYEQVLLAFKTPLGL